MALSTSEINGKLGQLVSWNLEDNGRAIEKQFEFHDFKSAVEFVNFVADIAELEDHHPDVNLHDYKYVKILLSTHSAGGLTEKDFKVASEIDKYGNHKRN